MQIPWEHTSLIGEFYFNPDTIYDGVNYSKVVFEDKKFVFNNESDIKTIVDNLKSHFWPRQEEAIRDVDDIDFQSSSCNELFVLGRNIYQAANGNCFACQRFIDNFSINNKIPPEAKLHILNGMAYEIYFDSSNNLRNIIKYNYYQEVVRCLEKPEFFGSKEFVASKLCAISERPIYIPGQNQVMEFVVHFREENDALYLDDILYCGKTVFYDNDVSYKPSIMDYSEIITIYSLKRKIAIKVAALTDMIQLNFNLNLNDFDRIIVPECGYLIKY